MYFIWGKFSPRGTIGRRNCKTVILKTFRHCIADNSKAPSSPNQPTQDSKQRGVGDYWLVNRNIQKAEKAKKIKMQL
jgi:hypothetical protein